MERDLLTFLIKDLIGSMIFVEESPFTFLVDADGDFLVDADGDFLVEG